MKKFTLFLLTAFAAFSFCFAASSKMNDDPEEEPIPLQYNEPDEGDAWVCEGSRINQHYYEYTLKILDYALPLAYTNAGQTCYSGYGTYNYLYHNLGFGGSGNGWYLGSIASIQGTFLPNFMIFNITPPAN